MLNSESDLDRFLRESLHTAADGWDPDVDGALRELRQRRQRSRILSMVRAVTAAVVRRFTMRPLSLVGIAAALLTIPVLLAPDVLRSVLPWHRGPTQTVPLAKSAPRDAAPRDVAPQQSRPERPTVADPEDEGLDHDRRSAKAPPPGLQEVVPFAATLSTAPEVGTRTVPDALWQALAVARGDLLTQDLRVHVVAIDVRGMLTGDVVVGQSPAPRARVKPGTIVTLRVLTSCSGCLAVRGATVEHAQVTSAEVLAYQNRRLPLPDPVPASMARTDARGHCARSCQNGMQL